MRHLVVDDLGEPQELATAVVGLPTGQPDLGRHAATLPLGGLTRRGLGSALGGIQDDGQRSLRSRHGALQLLEGPQHVDARGVVVDAGLDAAERTGECADVFDVRSGVRMRFEHLFDSTVDRRHRQAHFQRCGMPMTSSLPAVASRTLGAVPPTVQVLLGIVSVQIGAALAKQLFTTAGAAGTVTLRLFFAAVVLLLIWRPTLRLDRRTLAVVLAYGLVLGVMNLCFYQHRDRGELSTVGLLFALGAGICWGGYILLTAALGDRTTDGQGLAVAMTVAALVVMPVGILESGTALLDPTILTIALAVALLSSVVPYSLELEALRNIPPKVFGVLMSWSPRSPRWPGSSCSARRYTRPSGSRSAWWSSPRQGRPGTPSGLWKAPGPADNAAVGGVSKTWRHDGRPTQRSSRLQRADAHVVRGGVRRADAGPGGGVGGDRGRPARAGRGADRVRQDAERVPVVPRPAADQRAPADKTKRCRVLYVSPLKALAVDVERNLRAR